MNGGHMHLTPRQKEMAEFVARGMSTPAIASETGLSPRTVDVHIQQAAARLDGDAPPRQKLRIWFFQEVA